MIKIVIYSFEQNTHSHKAVVHNCQEYVPHTSHSWTLRIQWKLLYLQQSSPHHSSNLDHNHSQPGHKYNLEIRINSCFHSCWTAQFIKYSYFICQINLVLWFDLACAISIWTIPITKATLSEINVRWYIDIPKEASMAMFILRILNPSEPSTMKHITHCDGYYAPELLPVSVTLWFVCPSAVNTIQSWSRTKICSRTTAMFVFKPYPNGRH